MNWLKWNWWRKKGCYIFPSCIRCIRPMVYNTLCKKCEKEISK